MPIAPEHSLGVKPLKSPALPSIFIMCLAETKNQQRHKNLFKNGPFSPFHPAHPPGRDASNFNPREILAGNITQLFKTHHIFCKIQNPVLKKITHPKFVTSVTIYNYRHHLPHNKACLCPIDFGMLYYTLD